MEWAEKVEEQQEKLAIEEQVLVIVEEVICAGERAQESGTQ